MGIRYKKVIKTKVKEHESKDKEKLIEITERVEKNIYKITNNQTGYTRYRVQIWSEKAPLDESGILSFNEAKSIKSKHLKDNPALLSQGQSEYKTIEKDIKFAVTDTGIGMNKEQLGKVFDEFTQAEASTAKDYGGTGLGLPISKKMTEMMGGKMEVESEEGKGTTFSITIPIEIEEEE